MSIVARIFAGVAILALSSLGMWRILATGMSDHLASSENPRQALVWDANNPVALAALATNEVDAGNLASAAETARTLLRREPLNREGFIVLAEVAQAGSSKAQAALISGAAIRRAPYALEPRAWLADEQLGEGEFGPAIDNLDSIFRISGAEQARLFPVLIQLCANPDFVEALAVKLATSPVWRDGFVGSVLSSANTDQLAKIFAALQRHDDLDAETTNRWIDRLIRDGKWGEAYARWVGGLPRTAPFRVSHVYNGDFEMRPSDSGFDWRIGDATGVFIDRFGQGGADRNKVLRISFLDRRVEVIPLHQWLMLDPGSYRLSFRVKALDLRSDRGVQWIVRCVGPGEELANSERYTGRFDWKQADTTFNVPAQDCPAQELWLRNAGEAAAGKLIGGTILFDDVSIERVQRESAEREEQAGKTAAPLTTLPP